VVELRTSAQQLECFLGTHALIGETDSLDAASAVLSDHVEEDIEGARIIEFKRVAGVVDCDCFVVDLLACACDGECGLWRVGFSGILMLSCYPEQASNIGLDRCGLDESERVDPVAKLWW
jgi:hypothetical protein